MRSRLLLAILTLGLVSVHWATVVHADTSVTASNSSDGSRAQSGDATTENNSNTAVGSNAGESDVGNADIGDSTGANIQEGDNDFDGDQAAKSKSGAAVTGQYVAGIANEGDLLIDATNRTASSDAISGDAEAVNDSAAFVGLLFGSSTVGFSDIFGAQASGNLQEGDNSGDVRQLQEASSGNALSGQIVSGVAARGTVSVAAANTVTDSGSTSGDSDEEGDSSLFVGLQAGSSIVN